MRTTGASGRAAARTLIHVVAVADSHGAGVWGFVGAAEAIAGETGEEIGDETGILAT